MTHKRYSLLLLFAGLMLFAQSSYAQRVHKEGEEDRKEERKDEPNSFRSRLWYGGGVQLGFSSYFGSNLFSFGVSPLVGYKIVNFLSVGPRVEVTYTSIKQRGFKATSLFDVDAGIFIRAKVFRGLFFQGELSNEWYQQAIGGTEEKAKLQRFNQRLGAGWNFGNGQGGGSEIGVFYNFAIADDIYSYENPLGYRFGFTWNF